MPQPVVKGNKKIDLFHFNYYELAITLNREDWMMTVTVKWKTRASFFLLFILNCLKLMLIIFQSGSFLPPTKYEDGSRWASQSGSPCYLDGGYH